MYSSMRQKVPERHLAEPVGGAGGHQTACHSERSEESAVRAEGPALYQDSSFKAVDQEDQEGRALEFEISHAWVVREFKGSDPLIPLIPTGGMAIPRLRRCAAPRGM